MALKRRKCFKHGRHTAEWILGFASALLEAAFRTISKGTIGVIHLFYTLACRIRKKQRRQPGRTPAGPNVGDENLLVTSTALVRLGFSRREASRRIELALSDGASYDQPEDLIKAALNMV